VFTVKITKLVVKSCFWLWHYAATRNALKPFRSDWLIDYLRFYVPLKNSSLIWRPKKFQKEKKCNKQKIQCFVDWLIDWLFTPLRPAQEFLTFMETSPLLVKGCKFRPMLGTRGLWAGRDLYRAKPAVTRDLGFSGLIRRTAPYLVASYDTRGDEEDLF
jgi:hypothetical protein